MAKKITKRGRPKLDKGSARATLLQIRVSAAEKTAFADAAALSGESVSVWARAAMRRVAQAELEDKGRPISFLPLPKGDDSD